MPCHSPTPKSASKSSVSVYQGTSKPVRRFQRSMSGCGARETYASVVSRAFRCAGCGVLGGHHRAAAAAPLRPAADARLEEVAVDDQLAAALEQVEKADRAVRPLEAVVLLHGHPRHAAALGGQRVAGAGVRLLLGEHLLPARPATPAGRRSAAGSSGGAAAGELTGDALVRERCGDDGEIEHGGAPFVLALTKTSQPGPRFGQPSAQRAETPLELRALDRVGGERDRPLVRARGSAGVARAAEQLGVRRVQWLVALERRIGEQRLDQLQARGGPVGQADGDRTVELDHRRRVELCERAVELGDLRPVGRLGVGASIWRAVIAACSW